MIHLLALFSLATLALAAPASFPKRATSVTISYASTNGTGRLCLTSRGQTGNVRDGDRVEALGCGSGGRLGPDKWDINRGDGLIRLTGTDFCLDAGANPSNDRPLQVWTCGPDVTQQQWDYTDDDTIAITGGNQCIDFGPSGARTYQCTAGNANQIWVADADQTPPTSSSAQPSPSSSPPPTPGGVRIHPFGDTSKCLALSGSEATDGTTLTAGNCGTDPNFESLERWEITRGDGLIRLAGTNYCLDAGSWPGPNVVGKVWTCYPGLSAQQWYYTGDDHIAITGGTQCLDVNSASQAVEQFCSGSQAGQVWTTTA